MVPAQVDHTHEWLRVAAHPNNSPLMAALGRPSLLALHAVVVVVGVPPSRQTLASVAVDPLRRMDLQVPVVAGCPSLPVLRKLAAHPTQSVRQIGVAPPVRMPDPLRFAGSRAVAVDAAQANPHARPADTGFPAAAPATHLAADHPTHQPQGAGRHLD